MPVTYKDAGVDVAAGEAAVDSIKNMVRSTFSPNVLTNLGNFGACYRFPKNDFDDPVLVSSADGVGTKLKLAFMSGIHNTVGQDLVNHCVNDILAVGARPMFFLDYFGCHSLNQQVFEQVISGFSKACGENNCALIGGETAEMPGFYQEGEYDISGTIVGVSERKFILSERKTEVGDLLVGLPSTGLHTNGYSLARKVLLEKYKHNQHIDELGCTVAEALMAIHKSYFPLADDILEKNWLHGISHITGGGIEGNTKRIIEEGQSLKIDWNAWDQPAIFKLIQREGEVPENDIRQAMNLGIGLIFVINPDGLSELQIHLENKDETGILVGEIAGVSA